MIIGFRSQFDITVPILLLFQFVLLKIVKVNPDVKTSIYNLVRMTSGTRKVKSPYNY